MSNNQMEKAGEVQVGNHPKAPAAALVSHVKEIAKDGKQPPANTAHKSQDNSKEKSQSAEKK